MFKIFFPAGIRAGGIPGVKKRPARLGSQLRGNPCASQTLDTSRRPHLDQARAELGHGRGESGCADEGFFAKCDNFSQLKDWQAGLNAQ